MPNCTGCTVEVPQTVLVRIAKLNGVEVPLTQVLVDARRAGVHPADAQTAFQTSSGHHGLPGYEFVTEERDIVVEVEKAFDGTDEQAIEAGWQENEFGFVCPTCAGDEAEDPDTEHGSSKFHDPLVLAAAAVATAPRDYFTGIMKTVTERYGVDGLDDADAVIDALEELPGEEQLEAATDVVKRFRSLADGVDEAGIRSTMTDIADAVEAWVAL